jgi:hypothetical protein
LSQLFPGKIFVAKKEVIMSRKRLFAGLTEDDDRLAGFTGFSRDKLDISVGHNNDSSFIEPLVHISEVEKVEELCAMAKMVVLHDFVPCVDDELEVKRGQVSESMSRNFTLSLWTRAKPLTRRADERTFLSSSFSL